MFTKTTISATFTVSRLSPAAIRIAGRIMDEVIAR